ncbi:YhgE/Pip domain-containing protein [Streptomyces sp. JJ66]|uniref:YhgE/Pip domain-containing protein n=1 Tax=Streptomyces sp. JJ66 TaxID=2803843 RepID=UPI001C582968|nr:YhgE/Pip domain-containing protein [Streptomyces sp. JJ66]MBW1604652.1 YhgE/Pip domain-containing protein [Streptomyces sp. JJ66]
MRSPRLAALELRRFTRGRLPRAALVTIVLLPLLYGALYLWSFWDPYSRLDRIPVALVNEDTGASVTPSEGGESRRVTAGDDLTEALLDNGTFAWHQTSARDAEAGVESGRYYLSLTIPENFSTQVTSSSGDHPQTGALRVRTNDANNYIVGQIARTVFTEVRATASSKTARGYFDNIFVAFSSIHGSTEEAAEGASELHDGIGDAKDGAGELADGAHRAKDGSADLLDGVDRLDEAAGKLEDGAGKVADGTQKLADKVTSIADAVGPITQQDGEDIATIAGQVADGAADAQKHIEALPEDAANAEKLAGLAADGNEKLYADLCQADGPKLPTPPQAPDGETEPGTPGTPDADGTEAAPAPSGLAVSPEQLCTDLERYSGYSRRAADLTTGVKEHIDSYDNLDDLSQDLAMLEKKARAVQEKAPGLGDDIDTAVKDIGRLNDGAQQVHEGLRKLHHGIGSAAKGASSLNGGLADLSSGADLLDGGMVRLSDGSGELADGLHDGAEKIPDYSDEERANRSDVMSDPVELASGNAHAAPNYGTGFAPYFIPLALWVGAMVAYMLLPALNRRALAAGAPGWRVALAGWLPVAGLGALQTAALLAVLHWAPGLGLIMLRPLGTVGFLLLASACFVAIVQWLNAQFGPSGRILVLCLLMLQLTSAGGTYPVQTSPGFFNAIHPFLPMTYIVEGLRRLITGGDLGPVWHGCAVLLAYTVAALALTAWTARRDSVWSLKRLHPELTL